MTKREYLNSLIHDLDYYKNFLYVGDIKAKLWHHGEQLTFKAVKERAVELGQELTKINTDKTYKPWK